MRVALVWIIVLVGSAIWFFLAELTGCRTLFFIANLAWGWVVGRWARHHGIALAGEPGQRDP